jgi:hypothetical protein
MIVQKTFDQKGSKTKKYALKARAAGKEKYAKV